MKGTDCVACAEFPCADVRHECYRVPNIQVNPEKISIVLILEAAPADPGDYYYAEEDPLFSRPLSRRSRMPARR